jgi:hypothetical protein
MPLVQICVEPISFSHGARARPLRIMASHARAADKFRAAESCSPTSSPLGNRLSRSFLCVWPLAPQTLSVFYLACPVASNSEFVAPPNPPPSLEQKQKIRDLKWNFSAQRISSHAGQGRWQTVRDGRGRSNSTQRVS